MIKPSEVNTGGHFWNSTFQNFERETVARNITVLNQALAYDRDDDRWQSFTMDEYETFRTATSTEPIGYIERGTIFNLVYDNYLELNDSGQYTVTSKFLGVVIKFATRVATEQVIAR